MVADGIDTMVELGSGAALVGMVKRIEPSVTAVAVNDHASLDAAAQLLGSRSEASVS